MLQKRSDFTLTLLENGTVLAAGGYYYDADNGGLASAEIFDPRTETWTNTGRLGEGRTGHTANLLPSGKVLVSGGVNYDGIRASSELYDPKSQTWSYAANLMEARTLHTATSLSDGRVLAAGGFGIAVLSSAEIFQRRKN